jgi:predicted ATPase
MRCRVLDSITSLIDKSLLIRLDGKGDERAFNMLDVVREYASNALESAGEDAAASRLHAEYFVSLGEKAEPFFASRANGGMARPSRG